MVNTALENAIHNMAVCDSDSLREEMRRLAREAIEGEFQKATIDSRFVFSWKKD